MRQTMLSEILKSANFYPQNVYEFSHLQVCKYPFINSVGLAYKEQKANQMH